MSENDQDDRKYTREDMEHLVAQEVAKQRLHDVERNLDTLRADNGNQFAEIKAGLDVIREQFDRMYSHVEDCRNEMRAEIERDFATKIEITALDAKIDKMWLKIATPVAVVLVLLQVAALWLQSVPTP